MFLTGASSRVNGRLFLVLILIFSLIGGLLLLGSFAGFKGWALRYQVGMGIASIAISFALTALFLKRVYDHFSSSLQKNEYLFREVTDSFKEVLIIIDRDFRIQMLNRMARDYYRIGQGDYLGRRCYELFWQKETICDDCIVVDTFQHGTTNYGRRELSGGKCFELTAYPIKNDSGEVSGSTIVAADVSEQERYIENLKQYKQIVSSSQDLIAFLDRDHVFRAVNAVYADYYGMTESDIVGRHARDIIGVERFLCLLSQRDRVFSYGQVNRFQDWIDYPRYGRRYMDASVLPYRDSDEQITGVVVRATDITERYEQESTLRLSARVFENTTEGITITDTDGKILAVNPAFCSITGYDEAEVIGQNPRILKSGRHDEAFYRKMWQSLTSTGQWRGEIWNRRKNEDVYPELLTISAIFNDQRQPVNYVAVFSDISTLKAATEQLEYQAHHHALTGLPNRLLLHSRLEHSIQNAQREATSGAVIFIDLDNFKKINDSLGHSAGDEVLKTVASRLKAQVRQVDTVAHLSGDEFVVVMHSINDIKDAENLSGRILGRLQEPFWYEDYELYISGSLGIAEFGSRNEDVESLLKNADSAMYKAKEIGKNRYHVYSPELTAIAFEKVVLEGQLRHALENDELVLHYQPQVALPRGNIVAVEALVRWVHPEVGMIPPDKFIPLSEETGLIVPLGEWVLRTACRQMVSWRKQDIGLKRIAVNISGKQIQLKDLHKIVEKVLIETGLPSGSLELEITEGFVMQHPEQAVHVLQNIRDLGVELSIDDFGTGHSSLNYLKRLPINRLKIDRSFVNDVCEDSEGEAIIRAVLALGRSLDLQITAEGVETPEQREFLEIHGCNEAQGYLFSRALPEEQLLTLLTREFGRKQLAG